MERKLRFLEIEIKKYGISIEKNIEGQSVPLPREILEIENVLEKLEKELIEVDQNVMALKSNLSELAEYDQILKKAELFFSKVSQGVLLSSQLTDMCYEEAALLSAEDDVPNMKLGFIIGVILKDKISTFERLLWRISHGNIFMRQSDIERPMEDEYRSKKTVFIVFFQGNELKKRVKQICEGFHANLYACPKTSHERYEISLDVHIRIRDLRIILNQTEEYRYRLLLTASCSLIKWHTKICEMKAIYYQLNLFNLDITKKYLIGEFWIAQTDVNALQIVIRTMKENGFTTPIVFNRLEITEIPPTYNRCNKFTKAFQILIDAYGIPSYKELNPTVYTTVTFPFLFAIMFGDTGHGLLLSAFSLWLIHKETNISKQKITNEIYKIFFEGRYILLLMGLFSIYTGLIYNETFTIPLPIFTTSWRINFTQCNLIENERISMQPEYAFSGSPYPFGVDPIWFLSLNKMKFLNSLKMKISIILGVTQMLFGIILSFFNTLYFRKYKTVFYTCFPRLIFMMLSSVYLIVLIFTKWTVYGPNKDFQYSPSCAPSILTTFINMILLKNYKMSNDKCDKEMFDNQSIFQRYFMIIIMLCIPWMLLAEPIHLYLIRRYEKFKKRRADYAFISLNKEHDQINEDDIDNVHASEVQRSSELNTADLFIHQIMHTVEFILGNISHTASYLRLWALSLAHSQLSEILWGMIPSKFLFLSENDWFSGILLFIGFNIFAVLTVTILLLMEGLSAFLHTLRLHWVEFQSKFYTGQGYAFRPFSFTNILEQAELPGLN